MICPECECCINNRTHVPRVYICDRCGCIHGRCYMYESFIFVRDPDPRFQADLSRLVPYRLNCECFDENGEDQVIQRSGWVDPETRIPVQAN